MPWFTTNLSQFDSDKFLSFLQMVVMSDIPQQNNSSDCGMFSCKFAEYLSRRADITFDQVCALINLLCWLLWLLLLLRRTCPTSGGAWCGRSSRRRSCTLRKKETRSGPLPNNRDPGVRTLCGPRYILSETFICLSRSTDGDPMNKLLELTRISCFVDSVFHISVLNLMWVTFWISYFYIKLNVGHTSHSYKS